jgi:hypothetical protein
VHRVKRFIAEVYAVARWNSSTVCRSVTRVAAGAERDALLSKTLLFHSGFRVCFGCMTVRCHDAVGRRIRRAMDELPKAFPSYDMSAADPTRAEVDPIRYTQPVEKDQDRHFGQPRPFPLGSSVSPLLGEPTASNRRDSVGGLTCRGSRYTR